MEIRIHPSPVAPSPPPPLLMGFIYLCTCSALLGSFTASELPPHPTPTQSPSSRLIPLGSSLASSPRPISSLLVKAKRGEGGRERGGERELERERLQQGWDGHSLYAWCGVSSRSRRFSAEERTRRREREAEAANTTTPSLLPSHLSLSICDITTQCVNRIFSPVCAFFGHHFISNVSDKEWRIFL